MLSCRSAARRPSRLTILAGVDHPASAIAVTSSSAWRRVRRGRRRGGRAGTAEDPAHGDFATNVALRRPRRRRPPRELAGELADAVARVDEVETRRGRRARASSTCDSRTRSSSRRSAEIDEGYGGGSATERRARAGRDGVGEPDRPDRRLGRAQRRLRRLGRTAARVRRPRRRARVLLQRRRQRRSSASAPRSTRSRRGEPVPEDGYQGEYVVELAQATAIRCRTMLASIETTMERFRIHFDSWALQSDARARLAELLPRLDTYERGRRAVGALVRVRRRRGLGAHPLGRQGGHADLPRGRRRVPRRQARARLRPRDLRARRRPPCDRASWYAAIARMLGYDPERVEVLLYQFVHLTGGGEAAKASKRRRQRRVPRRASGRDRRRRRALVPRQPRSRPDDRDRPRPRRREDRRRIPSTTSSTRTPGSPAILRNAEGAPGRLTARAARRRGEGADQAPHRLPGHVRRRRSGAGRSSSRPTRSASRTTSTASTRRAACSASRRNRSGSGCAARRSG